MPFYLLLAFFAATYTSGYGGHKSLLRQRHQVGTRTSPVFSQRYDDFQSSEMLVQEQVESPDYALIDSIRKWCLLNYNSRSEIYVSSSLSKANIITDVWKGILLSLRVMQQDAELPIYQSVHVFPELKNNNDHINELYNFLKVYSIDVESSLNNSASIFQPNFERKLHFDVIKSENPTINGMLLLSIATFRVTIDVANFDDLINYVPSTTDPGEANYDTNDIESFPFPTVFDFISEINRPPDPFTMNELIFKFGIKDFKYDLEKMKKKKDPQEVVDSINCKLTRLAKWRKVLNSGNDMPDPDTDIADWGNKVRRKYQSLVTVARLDPKKALDTQYDKRNTFIKIIDLWSDRLKRNFKYIYQPQRVPEDFMAPIMNSQWRNEVVNITRLFAQSLFLDLDGPFFIAGQPEPLFHPDRAVLWEADYSVEIAMYEMLIWLQNIAIAKELAVCKIDNYDDEFASITQHTYSRGFVTERVMTDMWIGLDKWMTLVLDATNTITTNKIVLNSTELAYGLSINGPHRLSKLANTMDHTDEFLQTLNQMNAKARSLSIEESKSVKDVFKQLHLDGKDLSEWWTLFVRDSDLASEMDNIAKSRVAMQDRWSDIITTTVEDTLSNQNGLGNEGITALQAAADAEKNSDLWSNKYKKTVVMCEELNSYLPWKREVTENYISEKIEELSQKLKFGSETVSIDFINQVANKKSIEANTNSYMFVMPRYFRGLRKESESIELSAFLEFCKVATVDVNKYIAGLNNERIRSIELVPLHPLMINQRGFADYSRRAPHPSIVFKVTMDE